MLECSLICFGIVISGLFPIDHGHTRKRHIVVVHLAILVYVSACGTIEAEPVSLKVEEIGGRW